MANDIGDILRQTVSSALQDAVGGEDEKPKSRGMGTGKGLLAGAALAAAVPVAKRGLAAARSGELQDVVSKLGTGEELEQVRARVAEDDDDEQPEPEAEAGDDEEETGEDRGPSGGPQATGKGRRMPIQQSVNIGVPVETAYNQFTQFEDWPEFMHRVTRVTQEDDCSVSFATKIWGKTKEFQADIVTQIPDERLKWRVSQGITQTGVVTFHELAPTLTRIELTMDVDPGSLLEKAARGMRFIKRAARADLHRFKAFIEMQEMETGAWRGVIEDGELVEPHDDSYDEERDYSDIEDIVEQDDEQSTEDEEQEQDEGENGNGGGRERTERFKRQAERTRGREQAASRGWSRRSRGRSGGASRSKGSSSGGSGSSRRGSSESKSSSGGSGSRRKSSSRSCPPDGRSAQECASRTYPGRQAFGATSDARRSRGGRRGRGAHVPADAELR